MHHLEVNPGSSDSDQIQTTTHLDNIQQKYRTYHPTPYSTTSIANLHDLDDVLTPTHEHNSDDPYYATTNTEPTPNIFNAGDSGQVIEQEDLTSLINHLHTKEQRVALLEFKKDEHTKQNKILQDTVDILQTCISNQDDS